MSRRWIVGGALTLAALAAAGIAVENATDTAPAPITADTMTDAAPVVRAAPRTPAKLSTTATPMAERVAVLGILNKRNGLSRDVSLKPGQGVRIGDLIVKLRACDQTEPWESDQLTGAFVQVIVRGADDKWRRYFSGWLFKETPSLNVVAHPVYDVWTKACTMRHPEAGPDTVIWSEGGGGGGSSKAKKSPASPSPEAETPAVAEASNAI